MTVSTATTVTVLVMVATSTTLAVAMMMPTTTAATCQMLDKVLYLFFCGIAVLLDFSLEVEGLASQRVVGVNCHTVFLNLFHFGHKLVVLIVHERDDRPLEDILMVEVAVNHKYIALQFVNALGVICTECLIWLKDKVER